MRINVLGVPDSAGAYCVGVERAPAALRSAGLVTALAGAGHEVVDHGDLTLRRWSPDPGHPFAQNVVEESEAVAELAEAVSGLVSPREKLLVLGGSCLVALGLCAGAARAGERARLIYVDRHFDLNTPSSTTEGSLSWMGMAHALDLDGAAPELAGAGGATPVLGSADLVYLGVDPEQATPWERSQVERLGLGVVEQSRLCADPAVAARAARDHLGPGPFLVHLDVDVLDFLDAPIAENVNGRNSGPTVTQLQGALAELWAHPDCRGLSIGQLDPAHAEADPTAIPRLVAALTRSAGSSRPS